MIDETSYAAKRADYFGGERRDFIDRLDCDAARAIIEIGCGDGATGAYARRTGKCGRYVGIELFPAAAQLAAKTLDEVHVANIETFELPYPEKTFDVAIASEVLEHLVDPGAVLRKLRPCLKPGARLFASSPNIAHHSTIKMLLAGRWDAEEAGRMDRTHLRWFTPDSFSAMFVDAGYELVWLAPLVRPGLKARIVNALTNGRYAHLFISQIVVEARLSPRSSGTNSRRPDPA